MRPIPSRALLLGLGVLLLLGIARAGWIAPPLGAARTLAGPVERTAGAAGEGIGGVLRSFFRAGSLAQRVRDLEAELARASAEAARRQSIDEENATLRREVGLLPRKEHPLVVADVLGPTTDGLSDAVRINRGSRDGILPRSAVIAGEGIVVGRVREVFASVATVDLLTSGAFRVTARALPSGSEGLVRGARGLDVLLEGVPRTDALASGDRLVTTGVDGVFPPHLLIGAVATIRVPEHAIFQEASVALPLNLHRLRTVAVLTEQPPSP